MSAFTDSDLAQLRVEGCGWSRLSQLTGIPITTLRRRLVPEYAQHLRELSKAAKARRRGVCAVCGGETKYNGHSIKGPSRLCSRCAATKTGLALRGRGRTVEALMAFLADGADHRYSEIRNHLGVSNERTANLLRRQLGYGSVVRIRWGVYRRAA